jgi:GT2 family glycosyltransferase
MNRIGVVTVTFNSGSVLQPFLRCCLEQTGANFEMLVIDNASADATREILSGVAYPRVRSLFNTENLGFAKASNQGITHFLERGFDRVLLINNDTEFPADLFAQLDRLLSKHRGRVITPRITFFDRPDLNWYAGGRFTAVRGITGYHDRYALPDRGESNEIRVVEYAPACCLMVDGSVFRQIGLLDERYFVYWEDGDFCMRMKKAGIELLYAPGTVLAHKASSLTGGQTSDFTIQQYHKNQIYFVRKHFGPVMLGYTVAVMVLKGLLRVVFRGDNWRQFRLRLGAMAEGLRNATAP